MPLFSSLSLAHPFSKLTQFHKKWEQEEDEPVEKAHVGGGDCLIVHEPVGEEKKRKYNKSNLVYPPKKRKRYSCAVIFEKDENGEGKKRKHDDTNTTGCETINQLKKFKLDQSVKVVHLQL